MKSTKNEDDHKGRWSNMKTSKNEDHQKLRPPKNVKSADIYIASLLLVYLIFWH